MTRTRIPSMMRTAMVAALGGLSLLLGAFPAPAGAMTLQIDPAQSQVHYSAKVSMCFPDASGEIVCPPPAHEIYGISGEVELEVIPQFLNPGDADPYRYLLSLTPVGIASEALASGLQLGTVLSLLNDGSFAMLQDTDCSLPPGSIAGCNTWFNGESTGASGTWDGQTLNWSGSQTTFFADFEYTITAVVASVPEPGTLLLTLPALIGLLGRRPPEAGRRRSTTNRAIPLLARSC